jgi:hypothetical protein
MFTTTTTSVLEARPSQLATRAAHRVRPTIYTYVSAILEALYLHISHLLTLGRLSRFPSWRLWKTREPYGKWKRSASVTSCRSKKPISKIPRYDSEVLARLTSPARYFCLLRIASYPSSLISSRAISSVTSTSLVCLPENGLNNFSYEIILTTGSNCAYSTLDACSNLAIARGSVGTREGPDPSVLR